jgi:succinyl-diaminopimelate desuccinylase
MTRLALELTQDLIRINTINPPGNERACIEPLAAMLADAGFTNTIHDFGPGRANLVARMGGSGEKPPLCFTGHVDTVPLGLQPWSVDPFAADITDGKLFGRGSSDMKSGVAAFSVAAIALAKRLIGTAGVVLVITAGEETGCDGAFDLARRNGALGEAGAMVVAEPTSNRPLAGHKGALWLNAHTEGVTAHGSMPDKGDNAIYKAARAISKLEEFDFNIARHEMLGAPTLNVGAVHGGININSVPDQTDISIDIRTIPGQDSAKIREQLTCYLGDEVTLETTIDVPGIWTDPEHDWIGIVSDSTAKITGESYSPDTVPYFTDASALTPAMGNPPTVILGPGEAAQAHQTDEYCVVERIGEAVAIYERIIADWCAL